MSRLTEKYGADYYFNVKNHKDIADRDVENDFYASREMRNKLGQLEDIEEELGISLVIYHKLMEMLYCGEPNILFVKDNDKIVQVGVLEIDYCKKKIIFYKDKSYNDDYIYSFCQYGKSFALTKEELFMSKGLEALREIESISERITFNEKHRLGKVDYQWIKEIICKNTKTIEKELKALEIIKIVCPNMFWIMRTYTYEEYKKKCPDDSLLQEEYELLKEVFKDD